MKHILLKDLRKKIEGQRVCICCSAPSAKINKTFDVVVSVSGGYLVCLDQLGYEPDISIFDSSTFNRDFQSVNKSKSLLVKKLEFGIGTELSLLVNSNGTREDANYIKRLFKKRPTYLNVFFRAFIVNRATGSVFLDNIGYRKLTQVGTGAWAVALCSYLGAKGIYVTGVNFRTGTSSDEYTRYAYGSVSGVQSVSYATTKFRNHAASDAMVLASCSLRNSSICVFDTNESEIEPLFNSNLT